MFNRNRIKQKKAGICYVLKGGDFYKIGCTMNIHARLNNLRTAGPYQTHTAHIIKTDDIRGLEGYWHKRFADKRLNGEWFALNVADLNEICKIKCATVDKCGRLVALDQTFLALAKETDNDNKTNEQQRKRNIMSWDEIMPKTGSALKAADLQAMNITACEVTIRGIRMIDYPATADKPAESKPAIEFEEFEKDLPVNITTKNFLKETFGPNQADCIGRKVILNVADGQNPQGVSMKVLRLSAIPQAVTLPTRRAAAPAAVAISAATAPVRRPAGGGTAVAERDENETESDPFAAE